jgi:hypothetical protein
VLEALRSGESLPIVIKIEADWSNRTFRVFWISVDFLSNLKVIKV